jgi:2,4'-dihydroxyacetophenone dioxygenase
MQLTDESVHPVRTREMAWVPTGPGKSFRPLRFGPDGWSELMRLEPGSVVARHRHTGEVHAYNLSGSRQILDTGEVIGPGDYVYEPAGNVDTWLAVGDEPCVVHIKVVGAVEYLDETDEVVGSADAASQQATYLDWCEAQGVRPAPGILSGEGGRQGR